MKNQTFKVYLNLATPSCVSGCLECIVKQIPGMQCPANEQGALLCDAPKVWKITQWKDNTSITLEMNLGK